MTACERIYAIDLETTTEHPLEAYLLGMCPCDNLAEFAYTDRVEVFVDWMFTAGGIYYAHNLKFDYSFLYPYFVSQGYHLDELITGREKRIRSVVVTNHDGEVFTLRDSYAIFSAPLASVLAGWNKTHTHKAAVEFYAHRPTVVDPVFFDYFKTDVVGLAEALAKRLALGRGKLTTSSDSRVILEEIVNDANKTDRCAQPVRAWLFPSLSLETDTALRPWYRGGLCYVNPERAGETIDEPVSVYDTNSMYPFFMSEGRLPYGKPVAFDGEPPRSRQFVVKIVLDWFSLRENYIPFVTNGSRTSYLSTEYAAHVGEGEPVELRALYLTRPEYELFKRAYDYGEMTHCGGFWFKSRVGLLAPYVEHFAGLKQTETGAVREFAKLMLNAPSGKFGENPHGQRYESAMIDGVQRFRVVPDEPRRPFYLPMSIFITALARCYLVEHIARVGDDFVYCDTDSVHCVGDHDAAFELDGQRFGAWKKEGVFSRSRYLRTKRYANEDAQGVKYKCAGIHSRFLEKHVGGLEGFVTGRAVPVTRMRMQEGGMRLVTMEVTI